MTEIDGKVFPVYNMDITREQEIEVIALIDDFIEYEEKDIDTYSVQDELLTTSDWNL